MKFNHDFCCRHHMMHQEDEIFAYLKAFLDSEYEQMTLTL